MKVGSMIPSTAWVTPKSRGLACYTGDGNFVWVRTLIGVESHMSAHIELQIDERPLFVFPKELA